MARYACWLEKATRAPAWITTMTRKPSRKSPSQINYDLAADLGVTVRAIGQTLQTLLGGRAVTTYLDDGEEYDVLVEGRAGGLGRPLPTAECLSYGHDSEDLIPGTIS